jgi:homeobox-leucine zipper protein
VKITTSSDGSNDESSSELLDADSPRTSDSNHLSELVEDPAHLVGYCSQFPPESFVGPGELAFPVKLEDGLDPSCSYFLPPMVEQGVLPWWDWA